MTPGDLLERIPDEHLRGLVIDSSDEPVSVIIELAVPELQVEYADVDRRGGCVARPVHVVPMTSEERAQLEEASSDAKRFLEKLLPEPPVYLKSARAFVATATGKQLGEIARQRFTKRIEPNRTLRR